VFANIGIQVSDGQDTAQTAPFSITVSAAPNRAPTISGTPSTKVTQGSAYAFTPTANDPDGDTLTFGITNKPTWGEFSHEYGALTGTPAAADVGATSGIVISVSDGTLNASLAAFSITVSAHAEQVPTISGSPPTTATQAVAYSFQPTAADADSDPLTFSIANRRRGPTFNMNHGCADGHAGCEQHRHVQQHRHQRQRQQGFRFVAGVPRLSSAPREWCAQISGTPHRRDAGERLHVHGPRRAIRWQSLTFASRKTAWVTFSIEYGCADGHARPSNVRHDRVAS